MTEQTPPKHPGGRPTKYKPEFCERVIELGKQGKSPVQIACALDVCRTVLIKWGQEYPEFMTALTRAKALEQAWFEDKGQTAMEKGPGEFNAQIWKKSVEARFRNDYTERREVDHSGSIDVKSEANDAKRKLAALAATRTDSGVDEQPDG